MLVSICIPTYNRLAFLQEAVTSGLNQSYANIEIVIGQDPTPNGIELSIQNWVLEQQKVDKRIVYFFNKKNLGLGGNWNACLQKATGDYYIMIGDDDRLLPNCIEKLLEGAKQGAVVSFCNQYLINEKGVRLEDKSVLFTEKYKRNLLKQGFVKDAEEVIWQNSVPSSAALVNTKIAQSLLYKADLNTPEIELFLRINQVNNHFYFIPDYLMEFRVHEKSSTSSGLMQEKLVGYLIPIPVAAKHQTIRDQFLIRIASSSINNLILAGDKLKLTHFLNLLKKNQLIKTKKLKTMLVMTQLFPFGLLKLIIKLKRNLA
ncbi:MAG: glycosyltransferase family 2 protein [Vicingaceae bacterium]|nr:glycosyltransferase family 2 protein [Vicingaceae bacterium]